jgi:hypothetical protein
VPHWRSLSGRSSAMRAFSASRSSGSNRFFMGRFYPGTRATISEIQTASGKRLRSPFADCCWFTASTGRGMPS